MRDVSHDAQPSNEEIDAAIASRVESVNFGSELARRGCTAVALDAEGNLVEYRPDGTQSLLNEHSGWVEPPAD